MKVLHRYIATQLIRNLFLCLMVVVLLFLVFDFFDRIDNILAEDAPLWTVVQYFIFKVPLTVSLMLPVSMMASVLLTFGLLSKNSEVTAMRASGVTVRWMALPLFVVGVVCSFLAILLNETVVPYSQRRVREIYNIDIRQKDVRGGYSQSDFWWRSQDKFYSVGTFDSRDNSLHDVSIFELDDSFSIDRRTDSVKATWIDPLLGWNMWRVTDYLFKEKSVPDIRTFRTLPLPIKEKPSDFYEYRADPNTMSFSQLKTFIDTQSKNGLRVSGLMAYLYEKFSFPFINFIVTLVVLPFSLRPARSGSMATSIIAALIIGFSYYAIHSFSMALGRAEIVPGVLAAWTANLIMGFIGMVLMLGSETP